MSTRNDYLPCKCWFENGKLHRAYFAYDNDPESPREWDNLSVIVNASGYNLCGRGDIETDDIEDWLIAETGINEDWYYNNKKRYGGIEKLVEKFIKEKCAAFTYVSVYDHSGICVYSGYCRGWDYSAIGFAYIPKDSKEVRSYRRSHTAEETKKWAEEILEGEIHTLDQWCRGEVYGCVTEEYDTELEQWDKWSGDSCWGYYLGNDEEKDAINIIKEFSGNNELLDENVVLQAIEEGNLDVLQGQQLIVFEFDVSAESTVKEIA